MKIGSIVRLRIVMLDDKEVYRTNKNVGVVVDYDGDIAKVRWVDTEKTTSHLALMLEVLCK
tara:strand:+ start:507 stop:689 length:183 start_codon:yes stop_codon:yes gene_type:complete